MLSRFLPFIFCLLPLISSAQFIPGAYILLDNPQKVYTGDLKYHESTLTVKDKSGNKITYKTDEIYYAKTVNNQRYISISGCEALSTFSTKIMGNTLVELVDSGRVCLMRYNYVTNSGSGSGLAEATYLVKQEGMLSAAAIPGYVWTNQGKKFYEAITPYAANRPDLQKLLADHRINDRNVIAFFHALNSGQPFPPLELRGKEANPKKAAKEIKERPVEDPFGK